MPAIFRMKLVRIGNSTRLTIPKEIMEGQGWKEGEEVSLIVTNGDVIIRREKQPKAR